MPGKYFPMNCSYVHTYIHNKASHSRLQAHQKEKIVSPHYHLVLPALIKIQKYKERRNRLFRWDALCTGEAVDVECHQRKKGSIISRGKWNVSSCFQESPTVCMLGTNTALKAKSTPKNKLCPHSRRSLFQPLLEKPSQWKNGFNSCS